METDASKKIEADTKLIREIASQGKMKLSALGEEYFARAGGIDMENPDFTIVDANIESIWGPWEDKTKAGANNGGITISWSSKSAGFGHLTFWLDLDNKLVVDSETMSKDFCKSVLNKLIEDCGVE